MSIRYPLIRRKAAELLDQADVRSAPIDVRKLAELIGAEVRCEPFPGDDVSGVAYRRPDGSKGIGVNSLHAVTRQRFTIAHEIGHLLLHDDNLYVDAFIPIAFRDGESKKATDPKEIESNLFAAELLMPAKFLRKDVEGIAFDLEDEQQIRKLAKKYNVSVQAMTIRLSNLGFGG